MSICSFWHNFWNQKAQNPYKMRVLLQQLVVLITLLFIGITSSAQVTSSKWVREAGYNGDGDYIIKYAARIVNRNADTVCNVSMSDPLNFPGVPAGDIDGTMNYGGGALNDPNWNWSGTGNNDLLTPSAGECIAPGAFAQVAYTVKISRPNGDDHDNFLYENQLTASAVGQDNGITYTDQSQNMPWGSPTVANNLDQPTPHVACVPDNILGSALDVTAGPTLNANGTWNITYTLTVENFGDNAGGGSAQAVDDVHFRMPFKYTPAGGNNVPVISVTMPAASTNGHLTVNSGFMGNNQSWNDPTNIIATGGTLPLNATDQIVFDVVVGPTTQLNTNFWGNARVRWSSGGCNEEDISESGLDPDPNEATCSGPRDNCNGVPVLLDYTAEVDVVKTTGTVTPVSQNVHDVEYSIEFTNNGDVNLTPLDLIDRVDNLFGALNTAYTVQVAPVITPQAGFTGTAPMPASPAWDGTNANSNFFDGTSGMLPPGESITVTFTLRIDAWEAYQFAGTSSFTNSTRVDGDDPNTIVETATDTSPVTFAITPVELIYFRGEKTASGQVDLEWATASEDNNDYFEIQHSLNGIDFTGIGTVQGAGNSSQEITYTFTDFSPAPKYNYYRLKQVDFDDVSSQSNILVFNLKVNNELFIGINPIRPGENLHITNIGGKVDKTTLFDSQGRLLAEIGEIEANENFEHKLPTLSPGTYFVVLSTDGIRESRTLIVR